jgi:hypothetical protein
MSPQPPPPELFRIAFSFLSSPFVTLVILSFHYLSRQIYRALFSARPETTASRGLRKLNSLAGEVQSDLREIAADTFDLQLIKHD